MYIGIEDEALTKYKERLLGNLAGNVKRATVLGKATPPPLVELKKITIICPNRPNGNIVLDLLKK